MTKPRKINQKQRELIDFREGMVVVDAGPGTGKTNTLKYRFVDIIRDRHIRPNEILMLTFTDNAADEMTERIKNAMIEEGLMADQKKVLSMTFDSFFHSIVMDNAEYVGEFFGIDRKLTRSARLITNETINHQYFKRFFDEFMDRHGEEYRQGKTNPAVILSEAPDSVYDLINRLISKGIIPRRQGWLGIDQEKALYGDMEGLRKVLKGSMSGEKLPTAKMKKEYSPDFHNTAFTEDMINDAVDEDRGNLIGLIHDIYWGYIERSIIDNRLTFALNGLFAFTLMYSKKVVRDAHKFRYVMIDEFQDTNANQLMVAMMVLAKDSPNLCAVGDWKQGIYGFRYVTVENITDFDAKVRSLYDFLNYDGERVDFDLDAARKEEIVFNKNYRSTQEIVQKAYDVMSAKVKDEEHIPEDIEDRIKRIDADKEEYKDRKGGIRFVQVARRNLEPETVADAVIDYVTPGRGYEIFDEDTETWRTPQLRDIAVLCRTTKKCIVIADALKRKNIPVFLQGDVEIMSTREGKIALAWLKYVMNEEDPNGYIPILADFGYSLAELDGFRHGEPIPKEIVEQRRLLRRSSRRIPNMLTQLFGFYDDLDLDVVQAITTTICTSHSNSLLTMADIVSMIEDDIKRRTKYPVEDNIDRDAVRVMTMHKSKGMEFGIVIVPFFDHGSMPSFTDGRGEKKYLHYGGLIGIRCEDEIYDEGYSKILSSWRTNLVTEAEKKNFDEERRLLFVTLSRAKHYETLIAGNEQCKMYDRLILGFEPSSIPKGTIDDYIPADQVEDPPEVGEYPHRAVNMAVHDIMHLKFGSEGGKRADQECAKGMEYGTEIHQDAQMILNGLGPEDEKPEHAMIRDVISHIEDEGHPYVREAEVDCQLPIEGTDVILRGTIDMLLVYEDHIEIHDWKTDSEIDPEAMEEYRVQVSVYALAAKAFYRKDDVRCYIQYVSKGITEPVKMMSIQEITGRVESILETKGE